MIDNESVLVPRLSALPRQLNKNIEAGHEILDTFSLRSEVDLQTFELIKTCGLNYQTNSALDPRIIHFCHMYIHIS